MQGLNSMFEVYLVGNNSHHFIISPTSVQGKADIRIRVAIPLDYETVDRYDFDVSLLQHPRGPSWGGWGKAEEDGVASLSPASLGICCREMTEMAETSRRARRCLGIGAKSPDPSLVSLWPILAGIVQPPEPYPPLRRSCEGAPRTQLASALTLARG